MRIIFTLIFLSSILYAQDSTISQAFKPPRFSARMPIIKIKYPTFPLRAGFQLIKEANDGDPFAQHELGLRYILKQGFPADTVKGIYWLKKAVEQNIPQANYNYGIMLSNGIGVEWNPFEAYTKFKNSAEFGMPESEFVFGLYYTDNFVVNRDMNEAYKWIKKSADSGYEPAQKALPRFEEMSIGNTVEDEKSKKKNPNQNIFFDDSAILMEQEWELDFYEFEDETAKKKSEEVRLKEIFEKNESELRSILGITRIVGSTVKDTSGIGLVNFAAESGSPEALLLLGRGYQNGVIFKRNMMTASAKYLRAYRLGSSKAAEQLFKLIRTESFFDLLRKEINSGNADAMFIWAGLAAVGFDFQLTNEQAFELLQKAGNKNHIEALIEIGLCYYSGRFVEKDKIKAFEHWQKAAELGSSEALVRIAFTTILESTDGNNLEEQINALEKASDEGSVLAQTALAYCYEKGTGVAKHKATAARLYRRASQRGSETAYASLKGMYDELRPPDETFRIYGD